MFSKIEQFFKDKLQINVSDSDPVKEERGLMIATAVIFLEMAHSDFELSEKEIIKIRAILKDFFSLQAKEIDELISFAEASREQRNDIWLFTNLLKENLNHQQKLRILEQLWELIFSDQKVDMYEDALIRKITNLLGLDHAEMIEAKLRVREKNKH